LSQKSQKKPSIFRSAFAYSYRSSSVVTSSTSWASVISMPRSSGSVTAPSGVSPASTNFDTFSSFMASFRPIFICPTSKAVSTPGPPLAAQ